MAQGAQFCSPAMVARMRRMRCKVKDPRPQQEPLSAEPAMDESAEEKSTKRQVHLLTFPHPQMAASASGVPLVAPGSIDRHSLLRKIIECCEKPEYNQVTTRPDASVVIAQAAIFQEFHKAVVEGSPPRCHYHVALKAEASFRFSSVKKALMTKFGTASHWSCTHAGYWPSATY